jgi:outer membrane protease
LPEPEGDGGIVLIQAVRRYDLPQGRKRKEIDIMRKLTVWWLAAGAAMMTFVSVGAEPKNAPHWTGDVSGGIGYWYGDMTYQIGGKVTYSDGTTEQLPDKISELKWPIEAPVVTIGGEAMSPKGIELRGAFSTLLSEGGGTMEDSDWYVLSMNGEKDIYSESDASLKAWTADVAARYWLMNPRQRSFALAAGVGALHQDLSWDASNLDQWYPQHPNVEHDTQAGLVITYKAVVNLPYAELAAQWRISRLLLKGFLDVGYAMVSDQDDHKLRYKYSETDADGIGFRGQLLGQYAISERFSLQGRVTGLALNTKGTQKSSFYGGEDYGQSHEVEHKVSSNQTCLDLAGVYHF